MTLLLQSLSFRFSAYIFNFSDVKIDQLKSILLSLTLS